MDYPIWDLSLGGGVLIALVAVTHVWVSHFAVGGGLAIAIVETLGVRRNDPALRNLARRSSQILILVSTVFGAISGVGIWVTIGLVQPAATSSLIHNFVWGWAAEWGFFILEVATALLYYATWDKVRPRTHLLLIWLYFFAAYMSLVIIQGIISFMLTPGKWVETGSFWDAIFNPTYFPGLVMRTGICLLLAGAYMVFAALREPDGAARAGLVRMMAAFQITGGIVAYGGYRFWEAALPEPVRAVFLGASPLVAALASARGRALWSLAAFMLIAVFAFLLPRAQRWPIALAGLLAAFSFFGAEERVREGARKPFVIRDFMFSNGILISEIKDLNERGVLSKARWAARESDGTPVSMGRAVYRAQCQACHTVDGYLSMRKLVAAPDADTLGLILEVLHGQGEGYTSGQNTQGGHVATQKLDYPAMPPLVGTAQEIEALKAYLLSLQIPVKEAANAR
ncbi:MAG: cytochrome ubiquinol oxidase subunit I [Vicinamibacteria bacterium]|nr:cytochrome ubiquinol oxidase subunit I [Vicinamibacteria bacterium]